MSREVRNCAVGERSAEAINDNGQLGPYALLGGVQAMQPGDGVVALVDDGLRRSGIPGAEAALLLGLGEHWAEVSVPVRDDSDEQQQLGDFVYRDPKPILMAAERLLERMIVSGIPVHGVANPSGKGLATELQSVLAPAELGANITNPHEPSRIMRLIQTFHRQFVYEIPQRAVDRGAQADKKDKKAPHLQTKPARDRDMYSTYPMGHGYLIVSPEPEAVVAKAEKEGHSAKNIGFITAQPILTIVSRGMNQRGSILEYEI